MSPYDPKFDLKINIGYCDLYFIVRTSDSALTLEDYLMYEHRTLGVWVSMTRHLT